MSARRRYVLLLGLTVVCAASAVVVWRRAHANWWSVVPRREGTFVPFRCDDALGGLTFYDPLFVAPLPDGSHRLLVVERRGTIQLLEGGPKEYTKHEFMDIMPRVIRTKNQAEEGLLGLAFHPQFANRSSPHCGELFLYYVARTPDGPTDRLSRFRIVPDHPESVDVDSESVLIDQPDLRQAHNGGSLLFGPDGFLYLGLGDDALDAPNPNAQTITNNLFSGIVRLDVDCQGGHVSHPPPRQPRTGKTAGYYIPNDNPFVGQPDALEEFYAIGLRNPWRVSFDHANGRLYASDPGDRRREEINLVSAGSNCGWEYREGTLCCRDFMPNAPRRPEPYLGTETWPLFEYSRDAAHRCVIGGYVYRGHQFPELVGKYVYADQSGRIYALVLLDDGRRAGQNELIAVLPSIGIGVASFGEDESGELYICAIGGLASETGHVFCLRRTKSSEQSKVPEVFDRLQLFTHVDSFQPAAGVIPYDINVPFWSDGAEKQRWVAVPPGKQITVAADGKLQIPPGTAFVKQFSLATDLRHPEQRRPLETRVLVCDKGRGFYGATYRWTKNRRRLVTFNETEEIPITQIDGSVKTQTWFYPGRFECALCHGPASQQVLGFNLKQLRRDVSPHGGPSQPQIDYLVAEGVLAADVAKVPESSIPALARLDDQAAPLAERVRSYLDVNCSMCHNPNKYSGAWDGRIERPLGEQGLINGASYQHADLGPNVRIIKPGSLELSMMHLRMANSDPVLRMPPLGTKVVDQAAVKVLEEWIRTMPPAPDYVVPTDSQPRGDD
jgi:uncharacterized repeat protein (TIGR03806 family)